jgi:hypothetical protein
MEGNGPRALAHDAPPAVTDKLPAVEVSKVDEKESETKCLDGADESDGSKRWKLTNEKCTNIEHCRESARNSRRHRLWHLGSSILQGNDRCQVMQFVYITIGLPMMAGWFSLFWGSIPSEAWSLCFLHSFDIVYHGRIRAVKLLLVLLNMLQLAAGRDNSFAC